MEERDVEKMAELNTFLVDNAPILIAGIVLLTYLFGVGRKLDVRKK